MVQRYRLHYGSRSSDPHTEGGPGASMSYIFVDKAGFVFLSLIFVGFPGRVEPYLNVLLQLVGRCTVVLAP